MTFVPVLFVRHGETEWNASRRLQGLADNPLSEKGRADVAAWALPTGFRHFGWVSSPLIRAVETARLLGAPENGLELDARLREMDWGEWDGLTAEDLGPRLDEAKESRLVHGMDFRPPGGESPREVRERVADWLSDVVATGAPVIAVAHMGVVNAMLSLATGWDMRGNPTQKLEWTAGHLFHVNAEGLPEVERLNISFVDGEAEDG